MGHFAITSGKPVDRQALANKIAQLDPNAPVIIMVHGFRYCPDADLANPHALILGPGGRSPQWRVVSWPRKLRLEAGKGLTIGFGWPARGSIWEAYGRAPMAGEHLSKLIAEIGALDPARKIHIIAHSLGARVALLALAQCRPAGVGRIILLAPAVFRREAHRVMARPGACTTEVFSVICNENAAFDLLLRAVMPHQGPTLGGGGPDSDNWLDLHLARSHTAQALAKLGLRIGQTRRRISHWSCYLRPGVWRLYRALLMQPEQTPIAHLRDCLGAPPPCTPRRATSDRPQRAYASSGGL